LILSGAALLLLALLVIVYYGFTAPGEHAFGERYVDVELPLIFPFYVITSLKPVTLITYLIFAGVIIILEGEKERLKVLTKPSVRVLLLFTAFASGYELIWNFFAWFSMWISAGGTLDLLANTTHEYTGLPWNFNFATKISYLIFALSLYASVRLGKLERNQSVYKAPE